jgi:ParA/MinD ATPase like.
MQDLSLDGVIIVTTPQRLALLDVERAINMVKRLIGEF